MATHIVPVEREAAAGIRTACRIGIPASVLVALAAGVGFLLGLATPPRSGPFCTVGCVEYPYNGAQAFFPRDYEWMIPAVLLTPLFTILIGSLHACVPGRSRPLTLLALCFSGISTTLVTLDYVLQALVVQPSFARHEQEAAALLTQYNPHGAFLAMEDLGYLMLAVAMLFAGAAVPRNISPGHGLRWILLLAGGLSLAVFVAMAVVFGSEMAMPFEISIILIEWPSLVAVGVLGALFFRRARWTAAS